MTCCWQLVTGAFCPSFKVQCIKWTKYCKYLHCWKESCKLLYTQLLLSFSPEGETGAMDADGDIGLFSHQYVWNVKRTKYEDISPSPCHLGAVWRFALRCIKGHDMQIGQVHKSSIYLFPSFPLTTFDLVAIILKQVLSF